jgi:hypothetical protein
MKLTLKVIPVELVSVYWDQLSPFIESALLEASVTEYGLNDVLNYLESGSWVAIGFFGPDSSLHGVATLCVIIYPQERVAFVTAIGGKQLTNAVNWQQLRDICISAGCSKIQAYSRDSVARLWRRIGFNNRAILVEADL